MALTNASLPAKRRILAVCVKLFLEQGIRETTVAEIVQKADVSNSSFQNIFRAKDGVLTELVAFMFETQFDMARRNTGGQLSPPFRVRRGDMHTADADGAEREPAGDLHRGLYPRGRRRSTSTARRPESCTGYSAHISPS